MRFVSKRCFFFFLSSSFVYVLLLFLLVYFVRLLYYIAVVVHYYFVGLSSSLSVFALRIYVQRVCECVDCLMHKPAIISKESPFNKYENKARSLSVVSSIFLYGFSSWYCHFRCYCRHNISESFYFHHPFRIQTIWANCAPNQQLDIALMHFCWS